MLSYARRIQSLTLHKPPHFEIGQDGMGALVKILPKSRCITPSPQIFKFVHSSKYAPTLELFKAFLGPNLRMFSIALQAANSHLWHQLVPLQRNLPALAPNLEFLRVDVWKLDDPHHEPLLQRQVSLFTRIKQFACGSLSKRTILELDRLPHLSELSIWNQNALIPPPRPGQRLATHLQLDHLYIRINMEEPCSTSPEEKATFFTSIVQHIPPSPLESLHMVIVRGRDEDEDDDEWPSFEPEPRTWPQSRSCAFHSTSGYSESMF